MSTVAMTQTERGSRAEGHREPPQVPAQAASAPSGWGWLLVLVPMAICCGGPLLVGALAAASAATLGTVGGILGALLALAAGFWWHRRRRRGAACCEPGAQVATRWTTPR